MQTAEGIASASFMLLTTIMAALVSKRVFSKDEMADLIDGDLSKLENAGLTDDLQEEMHRILTKTLKTFRKNSRAISH